MKRSPKILFYGGRERQRPLRGMGNFQFYAHWPTLILIGALAVKLTSPGPAFYLAKRAGLAGKPFYMLKLRSMRVGADAVDANGH